MMYRMDMKDTGKNGITMVNESGQQMSMSQGFSVISRVCVKDNVWVRFKHQCMFMSKDMWQLKECTHEECMLCFCTAAAVFCLHNTLI